MKRLVLMVIVAFLFISIITCAGTPANTRVSELEGSVFIGDGGKGISLTILPPRVLGLTENQSYITALVQGEFVSNFTAPSSR